MTNQSTDRLTKHTCDFSAISAFASVSASARLGLGLANSSARAELSNNDFNWAEYSSPEPDTL